jgi:hypothetical protein
MAELADAADSKSADRKVVGVRPPLPAPNQVKEIALLVQEEAKLAQKFEWEIEYVDLDACQMVLRLDHGARRRIPIQIFDTGELFGWELGDLIAMEGAPCPHREMEKAMGTPLSEDNYTLTNQKTGKTATVRFNDYEVDDAWAWLKDLETRRILK